MGLGTQSPGSGVVIRGSVGVSEGLVPWVLGAVRLRELVGSLCFLIVSGVWVTERLGPGEMGCVVLM